MVRSLGFLVVGLVVGWLLGSSDYDGSRSPSRSPARTESPDRADDRPIGVHEDEGSDSRRRAPKYGENASSALPTGTGEITGRVLDENGRGVPGVLIEAAMCEVYAQRGGGIWAQHPSERAERFLEEEQWFRARSHRVRSDAAGRFRITGLPDRDHYVREEDPLFAGSAGAGRLRPGAEVTIRGRVLKNVPVQVVRPAGAEEQRVYVYVVQSHDAAGAQWTVQRPYLALPVGEHEIRAHIGNRWRSEVRVVVVPEEGEPDPVSLTLRALERLEILVVPKERVLLRNCTVWCVPLGEKPVTWDVVRRKKAAQSYGENRFVSHHTDPGAYEVVVAHGHREFARSVVRYQGGAQTIEVPIRSIEPAVHVRAVDGTGATIRVNSVLLKRTNAQNLHAMAITTTGAHVLWVPGKTTKGDELQVSAYRLGSLSVPGPHGETVVARFQKPCYLSITAPEMPGPREHWGIRIGRESHTFRFDVLRLRARQPGRVLVALTRGNQVIATDEHDLISGPMRIAAPTAPVAEFRVESDLGQTVRIEKQSGIAFRTQAVVDSSGAANFGWIPLGTYKVKGGEASAVFRVDRSGRFRLR